MRLDLRSPERQLVEVEIAVVPRFERLVLRLPAWTPGSYLIRDYVRTLEGLELLQGDRSVPVQRIEPSAWRIELSSLEPLRIRYRILATELTVRTCRLSGDHAFLALAGVVLQVEGERWSPHRLELQLPELWQAFLPLKQLAPLCWQAPDFDALIDAPLEAGPHPCHEFQVAGVGHRWVGMGGDLVASDPAWLADVERVCLSCCRLLDVDAPPGDPYLFVLHLLENGYGGLEHDHASILQFGRRALARSDGRRKLLQLVAHEYLHQWNVRRLRPAELTPIDYDRASIVPTLWFAEGVTSYYDQFLPLSAGIGTEAELLEDLGADLSRYRLTPGRRVQSLVESSEEAWVKLYRQDAHSADNQISYYLKGAVLALVLDLHLRRHGSALAVVLRQLWQSHGRWGRGYRQQDLVAAFANQAGDLSTLLPLWLTSTDDPDVDAYLADVGLRLVSESTSTPHLGIQCEPASDGALLLKRVERHGPAQRAGLLVGDELLAVDGLRLRRNDDPSDRFRSVSADPELPVPAALEVLYCREGVVRTTRLQADPPVVSRWRLEIDPEAPAGVSDQRARWLALVP